MIRGKLPIEDRIPRLPGLIVSGDLSRLLPGQRILVDLEVVLNKSEANVSIDSVFLNTDLSFSGMFKAKEFVVKTGSEEVSLNTFLLNKRVLDDTCKEFYEFLKDGNIPLNEEFNRAKMLTDFKEKYDSFGDDLYLSRFSGWLSKYAKRHGYSHNPKCRGSKGFSIIKTNG